MTKGKGRNPGASGLNKHVRRVEHRERSQLSARKHLGQLEKRKDHVLRARKRKAKTQRLQQLKRAAAQRNPDEFNIGMTKAVMDVASGRLKRRREKLVESERKAELQKAMDHNSRNVQYLEYKSQTDRQRAMELLTEEATAALTSTRPKNKHVVFVDSEEEFRSFDALQHFDATPAMMKQHPAIRGRIKVLESTVLPEEVLMSGGHHMKSAAQKRRERQEVQEKLRRSGVEDDEGRAAIAERLRVKREMKQYRFADATDDEVPPAAGSSSPEEDGDEASKDEVERLLEWRRAQEKQAAMATARRVREVSQRVERSKSLSALAKTLRQQSHSIKRQMDQRKESRFKPGITRRSR